MAVTVSPGLRSLGEALGSEVDGIDLANLDDRGFAFVHRALAERAVLVFRDQPLDAHQIVAAGKRFGTPRRHAQVAYRVAGVPEVSWLRNVDDAGNIDWYGVKRATDWHTDSTFEPELPLLAMLHALEVPNQGGGTVFCHMGAAYDALPAEMQRKLGGLTGLHGRSDGPAGIRLYQGDPGKTEKEIVEQRRPAVVPHPVTGRPILFVNPLHTHGFEGMAQDEAWPLIEQLAAHATQPRFVYHHHWRVGDVVMWDERQTMHRGAGDYPPEQRRVMLRTIVYP